MLGDASSANIASATASSPAPAATRAIASGPAITWRVRLGIFLTFFSFYLLVGSRERPWSDATPVWQVAESIVREGSVAIFTRWPDSAPPGRNGKYYAFNPLLNSLEHVPGAALRQGLSKLWPGSAPFTWPFACHLAPAALGALTCVLFFSLCREHGVSPRQAGLATAMLGLGSTVWMYARYPYTEIGQAAFFTGLVLQSVRTARALDKRAALWLGIWGALLFSTKTVYALALVGPAAYLIWCHRSRWRELLVPVAYALAPLLGAAALYLLYNWMRWGDPLSDGYQASGVLKRGNLWNGLWGTFLSPGKSIFLYSPPLLAALAGVGKLIRRAPASAILVVLAAAPVVWLNCNLPFWHGDWAWGTRYAVFLAPVLMLPLALVIQSIDEAATRWWRWLGGGALAAVLAAGVLVQVLGSAVYWDTWVRISLEAKNSWLGIPNRAGASTKLTGPYCGGCLEDLYAMHWIPHFQPIRGHLWLVPHVIAGHPWTVAEKDAPWHPETTLTLAIADGYNRARIDWWGLEFAKNRLAGAIVFVVLAGGVAAGAMLWRGGARRARQRALESTVPGGRPTLG